MNKEWLLICFALLCLAALLVIVYPLRKNKIAASLLCTVFIITVAGGYYYWGGWVAWEYYLNQEARQKRVQAALQTIKSPQVLISKLQAHLQTHPQSARGWYLLGRLHASQNQWQEARDAFAKQRQLRPQDEAAALNYAQSLWQLNYQQFNEEIRDLVKWVLKKNPQQVDALAMSALDAYSSHDYPKAIFYWQQLLSLTPNKSAEAAAISKAIAKAQEQLLASLTLK